MSFRERLLNEIEENIQENVIYLNEINENMRDDNLNKHSLVEFTKRDIEFMLNLKDRVENGK